MRSVEGNACTIRNGWRSIFIGFPLGIEARFLLTFGLERSAVNGVRHGPAALP
jgi:hypothetical protein